MTSRRHFLAGMAALASLPRRSLAAVGAPFRMAYFETYSPLSYLDGNTMRGILVDVFEEVLGKRMGLNIEHHGYPWPRAQLRVQAGDSDAICTIATPARLAYALAASEPVVLAPTQIFIRADNPNMARLTAVKSLAELKESGVSVLSYAGNGWAKEKLADFNVIWGNAFDSSLKMLIGKRGDIMVENAITMQYSLAQTQGGDAIRMLPKTMDEARFQLLVSQKSAHVAILDDFNKAMRQFRREPAYKAIFERYGVRL